MNDFIHKVEKEIEGELEDKSAAKITDAMLSRYFTIKGKVVTVRLNFDSFSELVDQSIGDDRVEKLTPVLFDKLSEIFALIPRRFKIEVEVYVKDFGNYEINEAEKIVRQNFALWLYSLALERRRKIITGLSLLGGGVALLLVSYFLSKLNLPQILFDVINISGTLLVWESADITLIERSADKRRVKQFVRKFSDIRLLQG